MKKYLFIISCLAYFGQNGFAQAPDGYYNDANGKCGQTLRSALETVISSHTERTYNNLWTDFYSTDVRSDGKVWDMYSNSTNFTFGTDQAGNYKKEGDVYNREHSFPKSWFNDATPMYTDLFHIYPTDGYVNGRRSNYPFGDVGTAKYSSLNGSKLGTCSDTGYSSTVFEVIDEYKGDFARTYFYFVTCYEDKMAGLNSFEAFAKNTYPSLSTLTKNLYLKWAKDDPVSEKELNRNKVAYSIQKNRNPFIDHPEAAE